MPVKTPLNSEMGLNAASSTLSYVEVSWYVKTRVKMTYYLVLKSIELGAEIAVFSSITIGKGSYLAKGGVRKTPA